METDMIMEILKNNRALWVTATVTGSFAIIISVLNAIWLYLQRKKQFDFDKKLESYKQILKKKNYVSKVRFDAEFLLYRELMVKCRNMINDVFFVYPTYAEYPANEEARNEYELEVFYQAKSSYYEFHKLITSNAPFIPKEYYDRFMALMGLCKQNLDTFSERFNVFIKSWWDGSIEKKDAEREAQSRTREINKSFERLIDDIRIYLEKMDVYE